MNSPETLSSHSIGTSTPGLDFLHTFQHEARLIYIDDEDTGNRTVLFGDCLATTEEIVQASRQAVAEDNIESLTNLEGNYSGFFTADETAIAFSGLSGQYPAYYHHSSEDVLVSFVPATLAKERKSDNIDRATLGARIGLPLGLLCENYSSFEGVQKLGAGEMLRLGPGDRNVIRSAYETFAPKPGGSIEAAVHATRSALVGTIERRLAIERAYGEYRNTTDFSSGVDSSSLAFLTTHLSNEPVIAYIQHHPLYPTGDVEHARFLALADRRIFLNEIEETDRELPFSVISPKEMDFNPSEPHRTASIYARQSKRIQATYEMESTLQLTGTGGDALYASEAFVADLLIEGKAGAFQRDSTLLSRLKLGTPEACRRQARNHARYGIADAWHQLAEVLDGHATRESFDVGWLPPLGRNFDWLTPDVRSLLRERAETMAQQATDGLLISDYRAVREIQDSGDAQRHLMFLEGRRLHAPYLDHRVIRAALHCQAYERTQSGGQYKSVLRDALRPLGMPPELFTHTNKGSYSSLALAGLRNARAKLFALLQKSRLAALDIIDAKAVQDALLYHEFDGKGQAYFDSILAAEIWLRQKEEATGKYIERPPFSAAATPEVPQTSAEQEDLLAKKMAPGDWVSAAAGPHGQMALFHHATGRIARLNESESIVLRALNATNDPEEAVRQLAERYPHVPLSRLRADTATSLHNMLRADWLTQEVEKKALQTDFRPVLIQEWESSQSPYASRFFTKEPISKEPPAEAEKQLGRQILNQVYELGEKGFLATKTHVQEVLAKMPTASPPADAETAYRYVHILRHLSFEPAYAERRAACYELSLATILMAAACNKRLRWVVGVAFEAPLVQHTWVQTLNSIDIETSGRQPAGRIFQKLLSI